MKVNIKTPHMILLCILKAGDCFEHAGEYYIVTDERNSDNREIVCVNLETGVIENFRFDSEVFKMDTLITLRRIGEET